MNKRLYSVYKPKAFKETQMKQAPLVKKVLLLVSVSLLAFQSSAISGGGPSPYATAFDESIYDQSTLTIPSANPADVLNNPDYQKGVIEHLIRKKIYALERNLFPTYDRELENVNKLMEKYKVSIASKLLKGGGPVLGAAAGFGMLAMPGAGEALMTMKIFATLTSIGTTTGAGMSAINEFLQPDGNLDLDKLRTSVEQKKKNDIDNLTKEQDIYDLEVEYILKKPFIKSEEHKKNIETALLTMRKSETFHTQFNTDLLRNFLRLPLRKREIDIPFDQLDLTGKTISAFPALSQEQQEAAQELLEYSDKVKTDFFRLMTQIKYSSFSDIGSPRRFYYFYGKPGIGKTTAARSIAKFLGLPLFIKSVRTGADLSEAALEGQNYLFPGATPGFLAQALSTDLNAEKAQQKTSVRLSLQERSGHRLETAFTVEVPYISYGTYKNAVLLINDFDRILMDPTTTTQTLSFFLDYLDPEKKSFFNPYFNSYLPIEDLTIIVTGNYPIPSLTEQDERLLAQGIDIHDQQYASLKYKIQFQALRDRLVEIEFDRLSPAGRKSILEKFCSKMSEKYRIPLAPAIVQEILRKTEDSKSIRDAKKSIEAEILDKKMLVKTPDPVVNENDHASGVGVGVGVGVGQPAQASHQGGSLSARVKSQRPAIRPPFFDEVAVQKKVSNLWGVNESIRLLFSSEQPKQLDGLKALFGESGLASPRGSIESLMWYSKNRTYVAESGKYGERGGVYALANRIVRFECPQHKAKVTKFHTQAAEALSGVILTLCTAPDGFIKEKLLGDTWRKENLQYFILHLFRLSNLERELEKIATEHKKLKSSIDLVKEKKKLSLDVETAVVLRENAEHIRHDAEELMKLLEREEVTQLIKKIDPDQSIRERHIWINRIFPASAPQVAEGIEDQIYPL